VTQHIKPEVYPKVDDEATIVVTYPRLKESSSFLELAYNRRIWKSTVKMGTSWSANNLLRV